MSDFMRALCATRAAEDAQRRLLATAWAAGLAAGLQWAGQQQRYRDGWALDVPPMPGNPYSDKENR